MTSKTARDGRAVWLLLATFLVAVAGLIYELIAATLSSYLLGDSIRQFSFVIGIFLSSMGVGAWLSRYVTRALAGFIWAQILLGVVGGFLAPVLFFTYAYLGDIQIPLFGMVALIGILSGMEIPLIARVLEEIGAAEFRFENVLTVDYIGALFASVAFPLLIIPHFGLMSASLAFGILNLAVAGLSLYIFRAQTNAVLRLSWVIALALSAVALIQSERMVSVIDAAVFEDDVILSEATPYQKINITRFRDRTRLFLDHSIQFDTLDEHRYHETLVHPAMGLAPRRQNVLILGGGDGMAAREVLKHPSVTNITLVDLDPRVTELFRDHPDLAPLNNHALSDPKVTILAQDAWTFAETSPEVFDVIILDLPDPKSITLSKLYSLEFYAILVERLSAQGVIVTQAGSPLFAREAYWSIVETFAQTRNPIIPGDGLVVRPFHTYVPSFGDWGFVIAMMQDRVDTPLDLPDDLRFLTQSQWQSAQVFAKDTSALDVEANSLKAHPLVSYYQAGWDYWFR